VVTAPTVSYRLSTDQGVQVINSPVDWPQDISIKKIEEPWAKVGVIVPAQYMGKVMNMLGDLSGQFDKQLSLAAERFLLVYNAPLREIISGFDNRLKSLTEGRCSWRYELIGYQPADLVKLEVSIVNDKRESLARIVGRNEAYRQGQIIAEKLLRLFAGSAIRGSYSSLSRRPSDRSPDH